MTNTNAFVPDINWIAAVQIAGNILYFMGSVMIYLLLIHRLYSTFANTVYHLSHTTLTMICIMLIVQFLFMTTFCIDQNIGRLGMWFNVIAIGCLIFDILLKFVMVILFVGKLKQTVMMRLRLTTIPIDCGSRSVSIAESLNHKSYTKITNLMTKQAIIGMSIVLCSGLYLMISCIVPGDGEMATVCAYIAGAVEGVVIAYLLFLGLTFNDNMYIKVCGGCHRICHRCAQREFAYEISKDYIQMDELDLSQTYKQFEKNISSL